MYFQETNLNDSRVDVGSGVKGHLGVNEGHWPFGLSI